MNQARTVAALACATVGFLLVGYGCGGGGSGEEEPPPGDGLDGGASSGAGGSLGQGGVGQPGPSGGGSSGTAGRAGSGAGGSGAGGIGAGGIGGRPMGTAGAGGFGGRPMGIAGAGGIAGRDGARDGGADRAGNINPNQCQAGNMCTQNCTRACLAGARPGMQSCLCNNGQYFCGGCDPTDAGLPEVPQNFVCPAGTAAGAMCMMRGQNCLLQSDGGLGRICSCGGDNLTWTCRGN